MYMRQRSKVAGAAEILSAEKYHKVLTRKMPRIDEVGAQFRVICSEDC